MEVIAGHLYTASQVDTSDPLFWLAAFFITGLVAMIIISIVIGIVVSLKFRAIRIKAEQAGVQLDMSSDGKGIDAQSIEGCGYCIGSVIVLILGALGISLPIVLTQQAENLIGAIFMAFLGALCWGAVIAAIPYSIRDIKRRNLALDHALAAKAGKEPEAM